MIAGEPMMALPDVAAVARQIAYAAAATLLETRGDPEAAIELLDELSAEEQAENPGEGPPMLFSVAAQAIRDAAADCRVVPDGE